MLVLFIVLQIYLKTLEELLYFYQEVEYKLIKFQGYLSNWILHWDKQWKRYEISLYLYDWVEKQKCILEKLSTFSYGLYYTYISTIEMYVMVN